MKKYVWFLTVAAFAVAIFAMVGCRPATTPEASPSPSPTVAPTPDTKCPQPVSTVVRSLYNPKAGDDENKIQIVITFNEPIAGDVDCIEDENYWEITVVNPTRYSYNPATGKNNVKVDITEVSLSEDGKKITIDAIVTEEDVENFNYGLICDEESAKAYRDALDALDAPDDDGKVDGTSVSKYAKVADQIKWKLSRWCQVYDELGNVCCEDLEGEACCSPVCEPVTPPSGCPL